MNFHAQLPGFVDLFDLHRLNPERYPFLLQSAASHAVSGRYDILFGAPETALVGTPESDFFAEFSKKWAETDRVAESSLPFCGGWFLLLGYEAARWSEPALQLPPSPYALPDALAVRCTAAVIYDRETDQLHLLAEHGEAQLSQLRKDLDDCIKLNKQDIDSNILKSIEEDAPEHYLEGVRKVREYLAAGDIFQANLSRGWRAELLAQASYLDLYARLRRHNPAPFAGLARWGRTAVLSSSPERLALIEAGIVQTRPIAGTRPRGSGSQEDTQLRGGLIDSLKERAEHVMLIDLERNDLGRVCVPGSIEVSELMTIESYAHVHHIVSNVRGTLRANTGPAEVLRAVFPGGTITGCPKVRAMQVIAELEGVGRGPYTGAMGYVSRCGRMDTNILIRSLVCEGTRIGLRTGAGIVADSDPSAELAETRAKARGLLLALGAAT